MTSGGDENGPIKRVDTTGQGDTFTFSCEPERLVSGLVGAVSWVKGVEPTELAPLYSVVDTGALSSLYDPSTTGCPTVSFSFAGCNVQISPDAEITVRERTGSVADGLASPSNLLVFETPTPKYNEDVCSELLSLEPYEGENVLYVTASDSVSDRAVWASRPDTRPANLGVLSVGGFARSTSSQSPRPESGPGHIQVATVPDATDLTALGQRLGEFLSTWAKNDASTVICFEFLDELLTQMDLAQAFGFLYLLTRRIERTDAVAHYHLDTTAHDERTAATLEPLFDATVEHDQVDGWTR